MQPAKNNQSREREREREREWERDGTWSRVKRTPRSAAVRERHGCTCASMRKVFVVLT